MAVRDNGHVSTSEREILVNRLYDAPRDLVFEAFTSRSHLSKWWGPDAWH